MPPNHTSEDQAREVDKETGHSVAKKPTKDFSAEDYHVNHFMVRDSEKSRYIFADSDYYGTVWHQVFHMTLLHLAFVYGVYDVSTNSKLYPALIFMYFYFILGIWGVTVAAHRHWCHRSFKAKLPLKIFLMALHAISGQFDIHMWAQEHRNHHKWTDTDGDPHNSKRGFFFSHMGWVFKRDHPELVMKRRTLDCSDLLQDPVVVFNRKYFLFISPFFVVILPTLICHYVFGASWVSAFVSLSLSRYVISLHTIWFVNSAAHMFGDQPYNNNMEPRENIWVSWFSWGEGFHNYHHVFPWDYKIAEWGLSFNGVIWFIHTMEALGQAYDLKRASRELIEKTKDKVVDVTHLSFSRIY